MKIKNMAGLTDILPKRDEFLMEDWDDGYDCCAKTMLNTDLPDINEVCEIDFDKLHDILNQLDKNGTLRIEYIIEAIAMSKDCVKWRAE